MISRFTIPRLLDKNIYNITSRPSPAAGPAQAVIIGSANVQIADVLAIANGSARVALDDRPEFHRKLNQSVELLDRLVESGAVIYGVTTGFGASCETSIPDSLVLDMAANLVRYHGCGTGRILSQTEAIAVMVVRLVSLGQGRSGVRPLVLQRLCDLISRRIVPQIPAEGSVGASGDFTPLSYIAATLIGDREVLCRWSGHVRRGCTGSRRPGTD